MKTVDDRTELVLALARACRERGVAEEALALRDKALAVAMEALGDHKPTGLWKERDFCRRCSIIWPCPTSAALSEVSRLLAGPPPPPLSKPCAT